MKRSLVPVLLAALVVGCSSSEPSAPSGNVALPRAAFTVPLASTGAAYDESVTPTEGTPPYQWSVGTADLPPGISAVGSDAALQLAGTPTTAGEYAFDVMVTDADATSASSTVTCWVSDSIDLAGTWQFTITVTAADGVCEGEEGESSSPVIDMTQNASIVTASGFLGVPSNQLTGTITGSRVTVSGSYPEDGGTTTATHSMTLFTPDRMEGAEGWTWDADGAAPVDCPNGLASVTAVRLAP